MLALTLPAAAAHAQSVYDTTSSLTIPGAQVPWQMLFNTGAIPSGATASLTIDVASVAYGGDNRDFLYCGSTYLWPTATLAAGGTFTKDVSSCVRGLDLSTTSPICSENAWNSTCSGGFFYGTSASDVVLNSAKLTITMPGLPAATTGSASGVSTSSATVSGAITSLGSTTVSQYGIAWGTAHNPTISGSATQFGATTTTGSFSSALTGLSTSTTYYARAYVTNTAGTAYGSETSFTTSSGIAPPTLSTIASTTNQTTAVITWTTDTNASSTINYGTTSSYGFASTSDALATAHSITITGLTASTTYHFQVASGDAYGGIATSSDLTFTTGADLGLNPAGYWKLDETASTSDAADFIGTNTGFQTGTPDVSTDTPPVNFADSGSRVFDGNNYFTINRPVQDNFTICAWVKTTSTGGGTAHWTSAPIMDSEVGGLAYDFGFGIGNGGRLMFGNGGGYDSQVNGTTVINDDEWHDVCATRNGTTGDVYLYVDARLDGSGTTSTGTLNQNAHARIGYGYDGAAHYVGLIDDVRAYATDLSQSQVLSLSQGNNDPSTPPDTTPPAISGVAATSTMDTRGTITWATDENASSRVAYSADSSFASSTTEYDLDPRVTSHAVTLKDLLSCTLYNFKAVSSDAAGNYATSTAGSFTTTGCLGGAAPSSATSTAVAVNAAATTTSSDSGRTMTVATPANFTATSSSVIIQIKGLPADSVTAAAGMPAAGLQSAAGIAFEVTALVDNTTVLDSFDAPVTISYQYTDADVSGLDPNTLKMYHYHGGSWLPLDDCAVDTGARTVTCTTPSFSTFALFGSPLSGASSNAGSSSHSGGSIKEQVANLIAMGNTARADALKAQWPQLFGGTAAGAAPATDADASTTMPARDLELGKTGSDVLALQKLLNANGFTIAASGAGAPGSETSYFGALTKAALAKYQQAHGIAPSAGYFGPLTRARMKGAGLAGVWW
jgi:hypothetical protein